MQPDDNLNLTPEQLKRMRADLAQGNKWLSVGTYDGQDLQYNVGTDYLQDSHYITLYELKNKVFARVPTSARGIDSAKAEAAEHALYTGTQVAGVFMTGPKGLEAELPPRLVAQLPEGFVVLDFFSVQELRDFMLA